MDQKLSLDDLRCFDSPYTPLSSYPRLGRPAMLVPKKVRFLDYATIDTIGDGSTLYSAAQRDSSGNPTLLSGGGYYHLSTQAFVDPMSHATDTANNEFLLDAYDTVFVIPYTNIRSKEFGDFPGAVGDLYNERTIPLGSSDVNEIFTYTPEIPYIDNKIKIDIDISGALFMADTNNTFCDVRLTVSLLKGITWSDAFNNRGTTYASGVRGCTIDYATPDQTTRYGTIGNNVRLFNSINYTNPTVAFPPTKPAEVDYSTFRYTCSKEVEFFPGEKLFLLFQFDKSETVDLHLAFFSSEYNYRNTFYFDPGPATRSNDWSSPQQLTAKVTSPSPISYIKLTFDSVYKETTAPVYMVNESLSRAVELITNDNLRVYSEYFGREVSTVDPAGSYPYPVTTTGPAGHTCLTNGLLLRGSSPVQTWHMGYGQFNLDIQTGSSYTLDYHTDYISGTNTLLVMTYGTGSTVIIPPDAPGPAFPIGTQILIQQGTDGAGAVTIQPGTGVTLSVPNGPSGTSGQGTQVLITKVGDDSWTLSSNAPMFVSFKEMMEALNCIYAVGFGMEPDPVRSNYDCVRVEPISHFYDGTSSPTMLCENVDVLETDASAAGAISIFKTGYSKWEAEEANGLDEFLSRREYRTTLSSLRRTFDRQCKYIASGYAIEVSRRKLGTNTTDWRYDNDTFIICLTPDVADYKSESGGITDASGLLDPDSVYNYRISPARNALRWLRYLLNTYTDWVTGKLKFMTGDGNFYTQGKLSSGAIEAHSLNESADLDISAYADTSTQPIYRNEFVKFKYPLSYTDWKSIQSNRYARIGYSVNSGALQYGYIQELKYNLFEGMAEFVLKPAIS